MPLRLCRPCSGQPGRVKSARVLLYVALFLLLWVTGGAAQPPAPQAPEPPDTAFDRRRLLEHLAYHVMLPTYVEFATASGALQELTARFCAAPAEAQLTALQQAWRRAVAPLKRSEAFQLGPAMGLAAAIDFWPARSQVMQRA